MSAPGDLQPELAQLPPENFVPPGDFTIEGVAKRFTKNIARGEMLEEAFFHGVVLAWLVVVFLLSALATYLIKASEYPARATYVITFLDACEIILLKLISVLLLGYVVLVFILLAAQSIQRLCRLLWQTPGKAAAGTQRNHG